jgi:menaquinone-9 beta-reductase
MAKAGASVLVVERETRFQDRIRGEIMEPWGVAETRRLGIYDEIRVAANDSPCLLLLANLPQRDEAAPPRLRNHHAS